jgi:Enolase, C-terminal TIM barrel domain
MVSHRSGETEDNFIADLSVGLASGQAWNLYIFVYSVLFYVYMLNNIFHMNFI